jgi:Tfp pilus assembly protein PilO
MPELRQTRRNIKTVLTVMAAIDVAAVVVLISPLVGSTNSRRQQLNQLWAELQLKTRQVEPLRNLPDKVKLASGQIAQFYGDRFPAQQSQIPDQLGKLAAANGVTLEQAKYSMKEVKEKDAIPAGLQPIQMEADLAGNYESLARFVNALERDPMFFIIDSVSLGGQQQGPVKLQMKLETYLRTDEQ